jgi:tetratricopeptide (TPR) repeat protein
MRTRLLGIFALSVIIVAALILSGCVAQQQVAKEPTPEEIAARMDSIAQANAYELKKNRMFAYDKLKNGQTMDARRYLWKVIELDVKHEYNDWDRLYQTYMETQQADSAMIILRMGLEHHPSDAFMNATLGFMLKAQGQYEEALDLYNRAIEVENENLEYLLKQAELYEALDMHDEAIASYERQLELNPDDLNIKDRHTSLIRRFRDPSEYIAALETDVANQPDNYDKKFELLIAYEEQGLNEKIIPMADQAIALDATKVDPYNLKAKAQENLNKISDAIATYKALLEHYPTDSETILKIADNYRILGQFVSARTWVLKGREAAGGESAHADYILGEVYESAGDACSSGRGLEFDDKLIYIIAYGLYENAANSDDFNVKDKAERKLNYMTQFVPAYSDWFMNQTKKMPETDCYKWIKASWGEVKYVNGFLKNLSQSKG